ncbi:MAG: DUF1080 domain-containing protein [Prolixibacteraceae bacterium]|nr:DUF1080 domain-containing protein [Prolixibacteraceae bacterium]
MRICKSQCIITITLLFTALLIVSCSGNKNKQESTTAAIVQETEVNDENALFDGKTLDGWEITSFGTQGPVLVSEGNIVLSYGDGCTGITWQKEFPKVNYKVSLTARKTSGNDFFCGITFPVNNEFCSLIVGGWGGPVVGLSCIDGKDASDNETRTMMNFEKDVWYDIQLQVSDSTIVAWIDNNKVVDFDYRGRELYVRPEVELSRPFGICSWETTGEIRNIRLEKL